MKIRNLLFALVAAVAMPMAASAQTAGATASVTVSTILSISVTNTTIAFGTVSSTGYAPTVTTSVISHGGNVAHNVTIDADAAYFDAGNVGNDGVKPAGDLEYTINGGGAWTPFSTTAAELVSAAAAGQYNNAVTVGYRLAINMDDVPDTYTLAFTYAVVAD